MKKKKVDSKILAAAKKVTAKRPRTVIDHILKHGFITTQDLGKYGYNHPPRAARDVRESGIPLETFKVTGNDGRRIAAYRFGDPSKIEGHKLGGRKVFSKELKSNLYRLSNGRCSICQTQYEDRYLQIDHRIPYEVAGDATKQDESPEKFMLLCGSCQRSKSWTCERCRNWSREKQPKICSSCYWANVENHSHVAMNEIRRVDITWLGEEVAGYEVIRKRARGESKAVSKYIKDILASDE